LLRSKRGLMPRAAAASLGVHSRRIIGASKIGLTITGALGGCRRWCQFAFCFPFATSAQSFSACPWAVTRYVSPWSVGGFSLHATSVDRQAGQMEAFSDKARTNDAQIALRRQAQIAAHDTIAIAALPASASVIDSVGAVGVSHPSAISSGVSNSVTTRACPG
jgi:hypothetical protein